MLTFDATTREVCAVKRQTTATPLQALVLLNDPQYVEAARALAQRSLHEGGTSLGLAITFVFRTLTGRRPSPRELATLESLYREQYDEFRSRPVRPEQAPRRRRRPARSRTRPGRMRRDDRARPGPAEFPGHGDEKLTALLSSNGFLQLGSLRANAMDPYNLDDFRKQLGRMKNMGSMRNLMSKIPGMSQMGMESMNVDDEVQRIQGIIDSMTPAERRDPSLIDRSRTAANRVRKRRRPGRCLGPGQAVRRDGCGHGADCDDEHDGQDLWSCTDYIIVTQRPR